MKIGDSLIPVERIGSRILLIRGQKVLLDRDIAELYGVRPIALRQQVKRNLDRFPRDFMFQLDTMEAGQLVSQSVIPSKVSLGGYLPYVFTQEGVAMLSSVLRSKRAIAINIQIMRAFVQMRYMLESNTKLSARLRELEKRMDMNDQNVVAIMQALRDHLRQPPPPPKKKIGFHSD